MIRFLDGLFWGYEFFFGASNSSASQTESAASSEASTETVEIPADAEDHVRPDDGKEVGYQLEKPADGEEIAVLHTSMGISGSACSRTQRPKRWRILPIWPSRATTTA